MPSGVSRTQSNIGNGVFLAKIVDGLKSLTTFTKSFIVDIRLGSEFTCGAQKTHLNLNKKSERNLNLSY